MDLDYEDLPRMQSLTPEPDTISLKDCGEELDPDVGVGNSSKDLPILPPCENFSKACRISTECRSSSPLYSYHKYDIKVNRRIAEKFLVRYWALIISYMEASFLCGVWNLKQQDISRTTQNRSSIGWGDPSMTVE